jgi:hypothetical protein
MNGSKRVINRTRVTLAAGLLLAALAATGSTCSKVVDPAKQDPLDLAGISDCVQDCNAVAAEARGAEQDLHVANVHACDGDPECLDAEEERHEAVMDQIALDSQVCKEACRHGQGGGSGGE